MRGHRFISIRSQNPETHDTLGEFLKRQVPLPHRQQSGSRDPKTTGGPRQEALSPHIAGYPGIR